MGVIEGFGACENYAEGGFDRAFWFVSGLVFALAASLVSWKRPPEDGVLMSQLFFHEVIIFPVIPSVINLAVRFLPVPLVTKSFASQTELGSQFVIVSGVIIPLAFTTLLFVFAYSLSRPGHKRNLVWPTMLANQAAYLFLLYRWSENGI